MSTRDEHGRLVYETGDRVNIPAQVVSVRTGIDDNAVGDDPHLGYPQLRVRTQDGRIHTFSQSDVKDCDWEQGCECSTCPNRPENREDQRLIRKYDPEEQRMPDITREITS